MASIFTYQDEPPRIHSPWSTPGTSTPQSLHSLGNALSEGARTTNELLKLEPEHQDGPTEYKLHLLLRPRRKFLATSTTSYVYGSQQQITPPQSNQSAVRSLSDTIPDRSLSSPSAQARQTRLQQLTTQLLWRLQQSSPFHSSSNANLVLPVLPEATPRLGVPERPAKLLPGLEESQGALYEIGLADDGTLVGLVEDELQESLTNLKAMAASLGCTTNVLRKVAVGTCEWIETDVESSKSQTHRDRLWVAEVLVYPDSRGSADADVPNAVLDEPSFPVRRAQTSDLADHASTEQIRITLVGATATGKSSLLGTLSTSTLDNGRGRSRLSLLKHRHEIASGITSSVAHELVGYINNRDSANSVINYASGNVSSWIDIHNLADRLVFLSDSPGLPKFAKSSFRSLMSWRPSWAVLCVGADDGNEGPGATRQTTESHADSASSENMDLSLSYLDSCLRLHISLMVVITKLDLANKSGLRLVLAKVLSAIKAAGRKPVMLSNTPVAPLGQDHGLLVAELQGCNEKDQAEVDQLVSLMRSDPGQSFVPILMTSAVTGLGISKLHTILRTLPVIPKSAVWQPIGPESAVSSLFHVDEVFSIPPSRVYTLTTETESTGKGVVLCGHVSHGSLSVGNTMLLGPFMIDGEAASSQTTIRSSSLGAQASFVEGQLTSRARSYQAEIPRSLTPRPRSSAVFLRVRIVSLRTLRLPVIQMRNGETGTIGVEPLEHHDNDAVPPLSRARKGMVLANISQDMTGYHSFSATFPASDFAHPNTPVLILGGHAIVYVNSVRAAVKVTAVALDEDEQRNPSAAAPPTEDAEEEAEVFMFDTDDDGPQTAGWETQGIQDRANSDRQRNLIKLSFRFVSTVEWMDVGDQVLVVPTVTAAGPVAGPSPLVSFSGLAGFVGRVCEVF